MRELLGRPRVHPEHAAEENEVGVATGMYYTPMGGDIMFVEASIRRLLRHGQRRRRRATQVERLGQRVADSHRPARRRDEGVGARGAHVRGDARRRSWSIPADRLGSIEVHIHVPAGAIPKDGPSAGIAIVDGARVARCRDGRCARTWR